MDPSSMLHDVFTLSDCVLIQFDKFEGKFDV
jgi:hypothetical protein